MKLLPQDQKIRDAYLIQELSTETISKMIGVHREAVARRLRAMGVELRRPSQLTELQRLARASNGLKGNGAFENRDHEFVSLIIANGGYQNAHLAEKGGGMNKFNARKTVVDGITFASAKEAKRYGELKLLERAGQIHGLTLQPRFRLEINGKLVCTYVADFVYSEHGRGVVVEDVKGVRTPAYIIKSKLFHAIHGYPVVEV